MKIIKTILFFIKNLFFHKHSWTFREEERNVKEFEKWEEVQPNKTSKLITGEEREVIKTFLIKECKQCNTVMAREIN